MEKNTTVETIIHDVTKLKTEEENLLRDQWE